MSRVLFSLADKISFSKEQYVSLTCWIMHQERYDVFVLVGDNAVLPLVAEIKKTYRKMYNKEMEISVLILKSLYDVDYIFDRLRYKIKEFPDSEIMINYTHGSNKLAAVGLIVAKLYGLSMQNKLNKEDANGISAFDVVEKIDTRNSSMYYVKKSFNTYDFKMAKSILEDNYSPLDKVENMFSKIIDFYYKWDSFIYAKPDSKDVVSFFSNLSILKDNIEAMEILSDEKNKLNNSYRIADLINNASRRIEEGKYDDAIIRLYRALELIAEVELYEKYSLRKNDIKVNELKKLDIDEPAKKSIIRRLDLKYPRYQMPLTTTFFLLQKLYDKVGQHYFHNKNKYQELFQKRNLSVLVHGNYKYSYEEILEMEDMVIKLAQVYDKNVVKYMKQLEFPKFKI